MVTGITVKRGEVLHDKDYVYVYINLIIAVDYWNN